MKTNAKVTILNKRIDGVVIGIFLGFNDDAPIVVFPGNPRKEALAAKSLVEMSSDMIGCEVALLFQDGDPQLPLIVGRLVTLPRKASSSQVMFDGEGILINGKDRIELRCGKAVIIMERDGHITIRGTYLVSHASAANRIRGGSVNLN